MNIRESVWGYIIMGAERGMGYIWEQGGMGTYERYIRYSRE